MRLHRAVSVRGGAGGEKPTKLCACVWRAPKPPAFRRPRRGHGPRGGLHPCLCPGLCLSLCPGLCPGLCLRLSPCPCLSLCLLGPPYALLPLGSPAVRPAALPSRPRCPAFLRPTMIPPPPTTTRRLMRATPTPPRLASLPGLAAFGCLCRTLVQLPPRRYRRRAIPAAVCAPLLACASALRACCHSEAPRIRRSHSSLYLPELVPACAAGIPAAFLHCAAAASLARAIASAHCAAFAQHRRRPWVPSVARHHWLPLVFDATLPIQKILSRRGFPPRATSRCRRGCEPLGIRPATRSCPAELGRAISGWSVGQRVSRRLQRVRSPLWPTYASSTRLTVFGFGLV